MEYQKCGLTHTQFLIWFDCVFQFLNLEGVDDSICVKLPYTDDLGN